MGHTSFTTHLSLIIPGTRNKAQGTRADQLAAHQGTRPRDQEIFFNYLVDYVWDISYIIIVV